MFDSFLFPAGEVHVKLKPGYISSLYIPQEGSLNDHIMKVMLAAEVIHRTMPTVDTLFLPYLPYARQDRVTSNKEPFSLKVIGNMLNTIRFNKIVTLDVHSDVAFGCIDGLVSIPVQNIIEELPIDLSTKTLVIPDEGAFKKLSKLSGMFRSRAIALKTRDTETGFLKIEHVIGNVKDQHCIIVDDICDGGGTFIQLAEELYKQGASSVVLYVTHGIFSKGLEPLLSAGIKHIFTTNSYRQDLGPLCGANLTVMDVKGIPNEYFTLH